MADIKVGISTQQCDNCSKYLIGADIYNVFSWAPDEIDRAISYDVASKEILVNEQALMRVIQMVNPMQVPRKIRVVNQDEFYGRTK